MPTPYIKKVAKETGKSIAELEKKWKEAKAAAAEEGHAEDYAYITSIFKNMAGINEGYKEYFENALNTGNTGNTGNTLSALNESKTLFTLVHKDSMGNTKYLPIRADGELGHAYNQKGIMIANINLAYAVTRQMMADVGLTRGGFKDQANYMSDAGVQAWIVSNGNAKKFADAFSSLMKIKFTVD